MSRDVNARLDDALEEIQRLQERLSKMREAFTVSSTDEERRLRAALEQVRERVRWHSSGYALDVYRIADAALAGTAETGNDGRGKAGAVGKSETPSGGVGNQMPRPGSIPGATPSVPADDALDSLMLAAVCGALADLVICHDEFLASDGNQEQAYYKLAKYARPKWDAARKVLADVRAAHQPPAERICVEGGAGHVTTAGGRLCMYCGADTASGGPTKRDFEAALRVGAMMTGAAGQHAERVVELEAEVSTLREHLAEVNRLLSLNVAEVERLRAAHQPAASPTALDPIVTAQHDETGRMWEGPRSKIPPRFFECRAASTTPAAPVIKLHAWDCRCGNCPTYENTMVYEDGFR